jgi:mono/diheme cytochrome c family protein
VTPPPSDEEKNAPQPAPPAVVREQPEPQAAHEPLPLWLVVVFFAVFFGSGIYLAYYSGGFQANVFNPVPAAPAAAQVAAPVDPKVIGKRVFTQNCVICHQATGLGIPGQFPPLVDSEWVLGGDWHGDNHLVSILLKGLQGPVEVKGVTYNNAMPTWAQLTDEQIAAVLTYIRSEWGNNAPPISIEYVAKIRAEISGRADPWTQAELKAIPAEKAPAPAEPAVSPAAAATPTAEASPAAAASPAPGVP